MTILTTRDDLVRDELDGKTALARRLAGKYMTFKLAGEEYGLEILKVREIVGLFDIARVPPRTPEFIRGVINLRGKVEPVVDLELRFGANKSEISDQTIVVRSMYRGLEFTMGILVDEVLEVLSITSKQIEPPPSVRTQVVDPEAILGIGKQGRRKIFLLDIGKILTNDEVEHVLRASGAPGDPAGV